jgi:hypothetical protein
MNGRKLLLDSNIIIYLAKKQLILDKFILKDDSFFVSDISYMETLGFPFSDIQEKEEITELLSVFTRLQVTEPVVQRVITLRQNKRMKLPDAIIAATTLENNCVLVTRNTADFIGIDGIITLDPFLL